MTGVLKILLVEDDDVDVMNVQRALAKNGVECVLDVACDGAGALQWLADANDDALPHLVLLDLNLPRVNGIEFLTDLRGQSRLCHLPVVVLTTSDEERDVRAASRLNAAGYFVKPIGFPNFVALMASITAYWSESHHLGPGAVHEP